MKKINGMTNYIVMKGTSALNDDFKWLEEMIFSLF